MSVVGAPDESLRRLVSAALDGDVEPWKRALDERPWADPLRVLREDAQRDGELACVTGHASLAEWLKHADVWADGLNKPTRADQTPVEQVLRHAWNAVRKRVATSLARAREPGLLPAAGGVLAFVDALRLCLVVDYRFVNAVPELEVIDAIEHPRTVFDVVETLLSRPHETRNELKRMLQSSHRLVWHRDVLVHVDRREEPRVFGPSIDTLHLAELLASRYAALPPDAQPQRVLEVGTGSGFLSAALLRNMPGVRLLVGVERDPAAARCTYRNWQVNCDDRPGALRKGSLMLGELRPELLAPQFDLVVCNPPYIPEDPAAAADRADGRTGAVAGIELLDQLLASGVELVAPGGAMLLLASSVTPPDRVVAPAGFVAERPWGEAGKEVLFEVEEIFSRPAWLRRLEAQGGLELQDASYVHHLHAVWLTREGETA